MFRRNVSSGPTSALRSWSAKSGSRRAALRIVSTWQPTYCAAMDRVPPTVRMAKTSRFLVSSSHSSISMPTGQSGSDIRLTKVAIVGSLTENEPDRRRAEILERHDGPAGGTAIVWNTNFPRRASHAFSRESPATTANGGNGR